MAAICNHSQPPQPANYPCMAVACPRRSSSAHTPDQQHAWGGGCNWLAARKKSTLCRSCITELFYLNTWHLGKSGQWNKDAMGWAISYMIVMCIRQRGRMNETKGWRGPKNTLSTVLRGCPQECCRGSLSNFTSIKSKENSIRAVIKKSRCKSEKK